MKYFFFFFLFTIVKIGYSIQPKQQKSSKNHPFYDKAYDFRDAGERDSAFFYFDKAKEVLLLEGDSTKVATCLVNMGIIATDQGDYYGGIEISLNAINYLNQLNEKVYFLIRANYNNLGLANYFLRDYENALKYYDLALAFANGAEEDKRKYLNNKAKVYEELKSYAEAIKVYSVIVNETNRGSVFYAQALANLATTKWMENSNFNPLLDLQTAIEIYQQKGDLLGLNFCYARLADYYTKINPVLAEQYARKMYHIAKEIKSPNDQLEALYKLVILSEPKKSREYFIVYEKLADSVYLARMDAKNQFALIRYETEKHKLNFIQAQAEGALKENVILRRNILVGILGFFILMSFWWYRKRKKRLQQEKELEVKETELKYAKKVHDRVANKVYNVMMEVENTDNFDKTILADKLEVIYNISRDISYERSDLEEKVPYEQQIEKMFSNYSSDLVGVFTEGNREDLWAGTTAYVKSEIMNVLLELMTNMIKHSQATKVHISFERIDNFINIVYQDNGVGISEDFVYKNGLTNTGNRMADISGTINFDTRGEKGLKIKISFPVI